jgi:hypothetical protein
MQIHKNKKLLLVITVMLVIIAFLSTFIITGCGRRARAIAAANEKKEQSEQQNSQSQTEAVNESEKSDTEETVKESTKVEESAGNEDIDTSESEESVEGEETTIEETAEEETTAEETTTEETTAEEKTEYTADMPYIGAECTNIIGGELVWYDVVIMPGDTGEDNLEVRGFMSFDISQLLGTAVESAKISGKAYALVGTPVATYGPMIIKSVYWGTGAISPSEFDLNGTEITTISKTNFIKSPAVLKDDLQSAVNHARNRYQLCFYFKMSQTDGDGESDYIQYSFRDIILTVTYSK